MDSGFETAMAQWREGERRLDTAPREQTRTLVVVTERIMNELRRRLGGTFTTSELVELYESGTDWATELAVETAPKAPYAWDPRTVTDAAFARYVRSARDFAGGRRLLD